MNPVFRANTFNTAMVMQKVATQNKKNKVVSKASADLYNMLVTAGNCSRSGTKIISCNSTGLTGDSLFDGVLQFDVKITAGHTTKQTQIPVRVVKSQIVLPDISIVAKKVATVEGTNAVKVQATAHASAVRKLAEHNFTQINKPYVYRKVAYTDPAEKKDDNKVKKYIGKTQKADYPVQETKIQKDNPKYIHTLNRNTHDHPLEHFKISKIELPESVKVGDILDFADKKYKVTSDDGKGNWGLDYYKGDK